MLVNPVSSAPMKPQLTKMKPFIHSTIKRSIKYAIICLSLVFTCAVCQVQSNSKTLDQTSKSVNQSEDYKNVTNVTSLQSIKIPFTSCGGNIHQVRVIGCHKNMLPCQMLRGSVSIIQVDFTVPFDSRSLWADFRGRTGPSLVPVYVSMNGFHKDACSGHGITCPVKKGTRQTYTYEITVDHTVPNLKTDAMWRLTDYWGYTVACFKTDINIS